MSDLISLLLSAGGNCPPACGWVGWHRGGDSKGSEIRVSGTNPDFMLAKCLD